MTSVQHSLRIGLMAAALPALAGCMTTTYGSGTASTPSGDVRAMITWEARGARNGIMTANLSTGESYTGSFFQITRDTRVDDLRPMWYGGYWQRRWRGWYGWGYDPWWGPEPTTRFVTEYSGRVIATLQGADGKHMRCRFRLVRPPSGMNGGGQGECQLPNGDTVDAVFPEGYR